MDTSGSIKNTVGMEYNNDFLVKTCWLIARRSTLQVMILAMTTGIMVDHIKLNLLCAPAVVLTL